MAAIPSDRELAEDDPIPGTAAALEGKLVTGPDGKIYVVTEGHRHWVVDGRWIRRSRYARQTPIPATEAELQGLLPGSPLTYTPWKDILKAQYPIFLLTAALVLFLLLSSGELGRKYLSALSGRKWNSWQTRAGLLMLFTAAIVAREPYLFSQPRFWAEEGVIWFQYAATHSVIKTLLFVYPPGGYLNFAANIGAVLASTTAKVFGLEYAPAATTLMAFLIQVLAITLILFGKSRLFDSLWKAVVGCLIVIFAFTDTDEIWLNTINSMSFLGLITLILLFADTASWPRWSRWGARGLLVLAGLSSPYLAAILPLYVITALREKKHEQRIQCVILLVCVSLQAVIAVQTRMEMKRNNEEIRRAVEVPADVSMVNVFVGHMAYAAMGYSAREFLIDTMGLKDAWASASHFPPRPLASSLRTAGWLCFLVMIAILWTLRDRALWGPANIMISAFVLLASFTCVASLGATPVGRYAFLPGLTFLLLLLINIGTPKSPMIRYVSMFVLAYGLAAGILAYRAFRFQDGVSWAKEVQLWNADHSYRLRVWPLGWNPGVTISYADPKAEALKR